VSGMACLSSKSKLKILPRKIMFSFLLPENYNNINQAF
jgi:hypothetical protein